jgi:hypothetical protein
MRFAGEPFENELDAARGLLMDATEVLQSARVRFVVVGGWVPFLFHAGRFGHPGTYDVDVLLHADSLDDGSFDKASAALLARGYLRAVKNRFQAHRVINVAGEELVYHVDFLNERTPADDELQPVRGSGPLRSIYTPAMRAVFHYGQLRRHPEAPGNAFPSVETFIATKAAAVGVKKRSRDAFDVYVTVLDQDPSVLKESWSSLVSRDQLFADANWALAKAVDDGDAIAKIESVLAALSRGRESSLLADPTEIRHTFQFLVR